MEKRTILVAIIEDDGKFLLTRQSDVGKQSGLWGFPGGNLEEDETSHEAALIREVREEVGLQVVDSVLLGEHVEIIADSMELLFLYYLVDVNTSNVELGREIKEYQWLTLDEIENLKKEEIRPPYRWLEEALKVMR